MATADYYDGRRWNRDRVVAAQRQRVEESAARLGWAVRDQDVLTAPLPPSFVQRFEREHAIRLPVEYRSFLLDVGDGGQGPGLALRRLGAPFDDSIDWEDGDIHTGPTEPNLGLDQPFPHTDAEPADAALTTALDADVFPDELIADPTDAGPAGPPGALFLFDHGCAMWDLLVVTGVCAGEMWADRIADGVPLSPIIQDGRRVGFADYYTAWLDTPADGR